jgi:Tol biopolymer transport system component
LGIGSPTLSPDGRRVVVAAGEVFDEHDLWIIDVTRGAQSRLTLADGRESDASWTPDGKHVLYQHHVPDEPMEIMIVDADGSGEPEKLVEGDLFSLSPDGKYLVFSRHGEDTAHDLWYLELGVEGEPEPIVQTVSEERGGRVSPDGDYLAYYSDETGRDEIYLKHFPSAEGKWQASVNGGVRPYWSPKGDELFWIQDGDLMVVEIQTRPELKLGAPRRLFSWDPSWMLNLLRFDITADAERFLLVAPEEGEGESPNAVMLVENWLGE